VTAQVYVDDNFNGIQDTGELTATVSPAQVPTALFGNLLSGPVRLVSDQPLQAYAHYTVNDCSIYDDQQYEYAAATPGTRFVVPLDGGTVHLVATLDSTTVHVPTGTVTLDSGDHFALSAAAGDVLTADKPIAAAWIRFNRGNKDSSAAVSLTPAEYGGTEFWVPPRIDLQVSTISDDRRLILAYSDGTIETRTMPTDATLITTTQSAALYWFIDVNTNDPWDGSRRFEELWAIPAVDRLGNEYATGGYLLSTHDGNSVQIDGDYDGTYEQQITLQAGEMLSPYVREPAPHTALRTDYVGHVRADYPLLNWQAGTMNWEGTDEHLWGTELLFTPYSITGPLLADLSASPLSGPTPLTVQFHDQSSGRIMAWDWLLGNGDRSGARHPRHTYRQIGTYSITLTVTGPEGSDSTTRTDYISALPSVPHAAFSASPLSGSPPLTVYFTDQSGGEITDRHWDFGDGSSSTEQNPIHTYTTPGTFSVTLTVSGPGGQDSLTRTDYIAVVQNAEPKTWTFMLYFAGDNDLSSFLQRAVERMEQVQPRDNLNVLVLMDSAGEQGTYLYHVGYYPTAGIDSPIITDPWTGWDGHSERNTGEAVTLQRFITWARENYPADYYFLSIADHGRGTSGIAWDKDATSNGSYLSSYSDLGTVLSNATGGGMDRIDVIMLDACLMALLEVDYEIKDTVDYIIASQNLGWSVFAYDRYMEAVTAATDPAGLATSIAQAYSDACPDMPHTISVVDTSRLTELGDSVNTLAQTLSTHLEDNALQFKNIRDTVQVFDSYTPYEGPDPSTDEYIDLYHFATLIQTFFGEGTDLAQAAQAVMNAVDETVLYENHQSATNFWSGDWWDLDNAHGISLYFPPRSGGDDYTRYLDEVDWVFTAFTRWDEFLSQYFQLTVLPPAPWQAPSHGIMGKPYYRIHLPIIFSKSPMAR